MKIYYMGSLQRGSNQYQKVHKTDDRKAILGLVLGTTIALAVMIPWSINKNSPVFDQFTFGVQPALAIEAQSKLAGVSGEMKEATVENVVSEIARVFGPHGKSVVKQALDISMCESGWRAEAYNFNTNKTGDYNIFQVNSLWTKVFGDLYQSNWVENIRVAHEIYLRSHSFSAWVCAKKLAIVH